MSIVKSRRVVVRSRFSDEFNRCWKTYGVDNNYLFQTIVDCYLGDRPSSDLFVVYSAAMCRQFLRDTFIMAFMAALLGMSFWYAPAYAVCNTIAQMYIKGYMYIAYLDNVYKEFAEDED